MLRNLIVCSDGTGNTFAQHVSNVSHLVQSLDLSRCDEQLVFYDQGIGTNPALVNDIKAFARERIDERQALRILAPPQVAVPRPLATIAGLTVGYGLRANVREMYRELTRHYRSADDLLYFFGFSRGAFTVRALAGLIYRCGLPAATFADDDQAFNSCFAQAYDAYVPHEENWARIDRFRSTYGARDAEVYFLGLWDTVKSYGGLVPQSLPHLRHNPIVRTVAHAMALDERRSWFLPTSWGGIDADAENERTLRPDPRYATQQVSEVWFVGCHSDIGGGDDEHETAKIAFRWMLGHATHAGVLLDSKCAAWIFSDDDERYPQIHSSFHAGWWLSDRIPRWELDNATRPPGYPFKLWGSGRRDPAAVQRHGQITFHTSTGVRPRAGVALSASLPRLRQEDARKSRAERVAGLRAALANHARGSALQADGRLPPPVPPK
jgi:uncharacterized protein (DUF2235 family)